MYTVKNVSFIQMLFIITKTVTQIAHVKSEVYDFLAIMADDNLTDWSKCKFFWYPWYLSVTKSLKSMLNLQW